MEPGNISSCLQRLIQIKEMLIIGGACPIMWIYHKHGGQCEYIVNLSQYIKEFLSKLPVLHKIGYTDF